MGDEPNSMKPAALEQALFAEARQRATPEARAAYLDGACGTDSALRRRVALKVIKLGMDTKSVIARFEAEWQALALMDHPNIARFHEAGEQDGQPDFSLGGIGSSHLYETSSPN